MAVIRLSGFLGANQALHPLLLNDSIGVTSINQKPGRGDLRPWKAPLDVAAASATAATIYRMGRTLPVADRDQKHWLKWNTDVHAVMAPNAEDNLERTYYTGDGAPKWTNLNLISSTTETVAYRKLGVPAPATAPICEKITKGDDPDIGKYEYKIYSAHINELSVGDRLKIEASGIAVKEVELSAGQDSNGATTVNQASLQADLDPLPGFTTTIVPATETSATYIRLVTEKVGQTLTISKKVSDADTYDADNVLLAKNAAGDIVYTVNTSGATNGAATVVLNVKTSLVVDGHYLLTVNSAPSVAVVFGAAVGSSPRALSADSVASVFSGISGLTATAAEHGLNVTVSTTLASADAKIQLIRIRPNASNTFTPIATASKIVALDELVETVFYVTTFVTTYGEESAPSPVDTKPVTRNVGDSVKLTEIAQPVLDPAQPIDYNAIRIYRTQSTSTATEFFYVGEVRVGTDTFLDENIIIGEVLPTTTWTPPPDDLKFLTPMWNGMMAGISGRSVRVCETYVPYAWPEAYEILPANAVPVALATFGQTLVVLTDENPVLVTGVGPEALDEQPMEFNQSCISPKSAVGMGFGVAWASPDGLAFVGQGGAKLLTEGIMLRDDWQALNPSSIVGCMYERRYFGFYKKTDGTVGGFILDPSNPSGMYFTNISAKAVFSDPVNDALFILAGGRIHKFDAADASKTVLFKSKIFRMPRPVSSFACAEVRADGYPVTFRLYRDGVADPIHTERVTSSIPFRLPAGFHAQEFQIEVAGQFAIQGVAVAHSAGELAQV